MLKCPLIDIDLMLFFNSHKWICRPGVILLKALDVDCYNSLSCWNVYCQLEDKIADKYIYQGVNTDGDMLWTTE